MVFKLANGRHMLVLVVLFPTALLLSDSELSERKPYLSEYQDAWKSLQKIGRSYLYMRSYEIEPFYGSGKCIFTELLSFYEKDGYAVNAFGSIHEKETSAGEAPKAVGLYIPCISCACSAEHAVGHDPCPADLPESPESSPFRRTNQTVYSWAHSSEGYPAPNILESSPTLDKIFSVKYGIAFVDPNGHCDILRLSHRNNACEVWSQQIEKITSLCHFVFDLLCGQEKYVIYDEEYCSVK